MVQARQKTLAKGKDRGMILMLVLFVIFLAIMIGAWSLMTSNMGRVRSGHYRGSVAVKYSAEEAVQKTVVRLQQIADPTLTDSLNSKDMNFLIDSICAESVCTGTVNEACSGTFDPSANLDVPTENVVCNFMGTSLKKTQVVLVRKNDFSNGTNNFATFLINATSEDTVGRRKIILGLAVVPYAGAATARTLPAGEKVYLTSMQEPGGG